MKNFTSLFILYFFCLQSMGQINYVSTVPGNSLEYHHFKNAGNKLVFTHNPDSIVILNYDGSVYKTIHIPDPGFSYGQRYSAYISESLFDTDSSDFEYMVRHYEPFEYVHLMRHRTLVFGSDPMAQIPPPAKSAFVNFLLGQVPNVLTYPQSQNLCSTPNPPNGSTVEVASTFQRALFLKLYLEHGFIAPSSDMLMSECAQRYPEPLEALRRFGEADTAPPQEERHNGQMASLLGRVRPD
jgi:hypothetical protein